MYLDESPIPLNLDRVLRVLRLPSERAGEVSQVLSEFFEETPEGYIQHRVMRELGEYQKQKTLARKAGKASAKARKHAACERAFNDRSTDVQRPFNDRSTNHKPLTINHKPNTPPVSPPRGARKTSMPEDFKLTDKLEGLACDYWFSKGRNDLMARVDEIFNQFVTNCRANGKKYVDWTAAWTTWYTNAIKFERQENGTNTRPGRKSKSEIADEAARKYLESLAGDDGGGMAWTPGNGVDPYRRG